MEIPVILDAGPDFKMVFDKAAEAVISTPKRKGRKSGDRIGGKIHEFFTVVGLDVKRQDKFSCLQHGVVSICGRRREMEDVVSVVLSFVAEADGVFIVFGVVADYNKYVRTYVRELRERISNKENDERIEIIFLCSLDRYDAWSVNEFATMCLDLGGTNPVLNFADKNVVGGFPTTINRYVELEKASFSYWLLQFSGFKERLVVDSLFLIKMALECSVPFQMECALEALSKEHLTLQDGELG
ncbi:hypothetical protein SUGI_0333430 [Cryptomeria japonica]|nr:hypothetical protein SUGI_0333430 [Cryptomeria japonica]